MSLQGRSDLYMTIRPLGSVTSLLHHGNGRANSANGRHSTVDPQSWALIEHARLHRNPRLANPEAQCL
jgi:hypothetical protein